MTDSVHQSHEADPRHMGIRHTSRDELRGELSPEPPTVEPEVPRAYAPGVRRLERRGNSAARASMMQRAQRTFGNRAVQRTIRPLPVQREDTPWYRRAWNSVSNTASEAANRVSDTVHEAGQGISSFAQNAASTATNTLGTGILGMGVGMQSHIDNLMAQQRANDARTGQHGVLHDIQGLAGLERQSEQTAAYNVHGMEQSVEHAETWAADRLGGGAHWLANQLSGVPGVGGMAEMGANLVDTSAHASAGGARALTRMVGGMGEMAANPIGTAEHVWQMAENNPILNMIPVNPFRAAHGALDVARGGDVGTAAGHWLNPVRAQADSSQAVLGMLGDTVRPGVDAMRHGDIAGGATDVATSLYLTFSGEGGGEGGAARAAEGAAARGAERGLAHASPGAGALERGGSAVHPSTPVAATPVAPHGPLESPVAAQTPSLSPTPAPAPVLAPTPAPVPRPVMEMPAVNPADAAAGRMPRDWGSYAVGRGRQAGHVGEMPIVSPSQMGGLEPAGFRNNAGAIRPHPAEPIVGSAQAPRAALDPLGGAGQMPRGADPVAPTLEAPNPFGPTLEAPNPFGPTGEMPGGSGTPSGMGPGGGQTLPGLGPGGGRQTLPGLGPGGGRQTLHGLGPAEPVSPPAHGLAEDPNVIAAEHEGARVPVHQDPHSGRFVPGHEPAGGFGDRDFNRLPGFVRDLMKTGDVDAIREVLGGHGVDIGQYLRDLGLME